MAPDFDALPTDVLAAMEGGEEEWNPSSTPAPSSDGRKMTGSGAGTVREP